MKKKTIIIFIALIVIIVAGLVALFIIKPWSNGNNGHNVGVNYNDISASTALLNLHHKNEITKIQNHYKIKAIKFEDKYYFENVECFGQKMNFSYLFDSNDYLLESNVYANLSVEKSDIMAKCTDLVKSFSTTFGVENPSSYLIYTDNAALDINEENSYHMIYEGQAILEFKVRDYSNSFWIMNIQKINADNILFTIQHFVGNESYAESIANLDLT